MKILISNGSLALGGAERVTIHLMEYFNRHRNEVFLLTNNVSEKEYEIPLGTTRYSLKNQKIYKQILEIRNCLKEVKPEVIVVMASTLSMQYVLATTGLNIPLVISERNSPTNFSGRKITKIISDFFMRFATSHVFQTEEAQHYYKYCRKPFAIIPNPLITDGLPDYYTGVRKKEIVTMGRLTPQKNQLFLIKSFEKVLKQFPEYKLVIYGEGSLRNELEAYIEIQNLQGKVLLPGSLNNVHKEIVDASMFVMSSDFEGMPNALIEAMALGLPCISTDCSCGGPRYLINDGVNGRLVSCNAVEELANCMMNMLEKEDTMQRMGKEAYKIREQLAIDVVGEQWKALIKRIA